MNLFKKTSLFALALFSFYGLADKALAAVIVNDPFSNVTQNGLCSLSEAILNINNQNQSGSNDCLSGLGENTIVLENNVSITEPFMNGFNNFVGTPFITTDITIEGDDFSISRDSNEEFSLFRSNLAIDFTIKNATLSGATEGNQYLGGIIFSHYIRNLNVENSVIKNSSNSVYVLGGKQSNVNFYKTTFENNFSNVIEVDRVNLKIEESDFIDNTGSEIFGAYPSSSSLISVSSSLVRINKTTFNENTDATMLSSYGGWGTESLSKINIQSSTFSNNQNPHWHSVLNIESSIDLNIINSTFSGNSSIGNTLSFLNFDDLSQSNISYSTFVNNQIIPSEAYPNSSVVNMMQPNGIDFSLKNNIFHQNVGGDCSLETSTGITIENNLSDDGTCGAVSATGVDMNLDFNGGPTRTHKLLPGSNAIDSATHIGCPKADQRGFARMIDGNNDGVSACDIGAYEYRRKARPANPVRPTLSINSNVNPLPIAPKPTQEKEEVKEVFEKISEKSEVK